VFILFELAAAQALMHPFIMNSGSTQARSKAIEKIKNFNAKRKWQVIFSLQFDTLSS